MKALLRLLFVHGLLVLARLCDAALPQAINYQGYLTNPGGTPVTATVPMTFRLYSASTGGSALWTETQPSVLVTNGNFNVVLGSITPVSAAFDVPYWLGVQVGADAEMAPRQPLASSPYALRAASLDGAATLPAGNLTGTIDAAQIADHAITQAKLAPTSGAAPGKVLGTDGTNLQWQAGGSGTVTSVGTGSGLSGGPITGNGTISLLATQLLPLAQCATGQIPKWAANAWVCAADDNAAPAGGSAGQLLAGTGGAPAWTDSPALNGNLVLVPTTATSGNILKGSNRFIHNFGTRNTFIGESAGNFAMTGSNNTAAGANALIGNSTGSNNTASGTNALSANTAGTMNVAVGTYTLGANTTGGGNTATGAQALQSTNGSNNTASGWFAMGFNTTGSQNTASGWSALRNNTTGNGNIAIGSFAGQNLTTGNDNIAIGNDGVAAESGTIRIGAGSKHTQTFIAGIRGVTTGIADPLPVVIDSAGQLGTGASASGTVTSIATGTGLTGGPITVAGTIGLAATQLLPSTACAASQIAKWDGAAWACAADNTAAPSGGAAGQVLAGTSGGPVWTDSPALGGNLALATSTATTGNIVKGTNTFIHNFGNANTFLGEGAGNFLITGSSNTGSGWMALSSNTSGYENTGNGHTALWQNTIGFQNTAIGTAALGLNTNGNANTAAGAWALSHNTSGKFNTASGSRALYSNIDGDNNTASGEGALYSNLSGYQSAAVGANALYSNTTGVANTANGFRALYANTTGRNNTAVGWGALDNKVTGDDNIAIGALAGFDLTAGSNNIMIGSQGSYSESDTIRIGYGQTRFIVAGIRGVILPTISDPLPVLIASGGQLGTPTSSRRFKEDIADMDAASSALMQLRPVTFHYKTDQNPSSRRLQYGLIAEEVAEVYPGLVAHSADGQIESVMYQFLPPMLLNELQKQQRMIEAQSARITMLEHELSEIKLTLGAK